MGEIFPNRQGLTNGELKEILQKNQIQILLP